MNEKSHRPLPDESEIDSTHSLFDLDQHFPHASEAFLYSEFQYWIFVPKGKQIFVNRFKNRGVVSLLFTMPFS